MFEAIFEAFIDSIKLIPFLFFTYLAMGFLERAASDRSKQLIKRAGKFGPIWGGLLGAFPQCGFSAAASNLYVGRILTLGTLISIYLSTSDEMLPIFISEKVGAATILKILGAKVVIGVISGFLIELLFGWIARRHKTPSGFDAEPENTSCNCNTSILINAIFHSIQVFFFIFIVSVAIGLIISFIGEESVSMIFADIPVLGEMIAAFVGLIPNCAASVVITQLYIDGIIGSGPMMSGLLVSAGVGILVLFKENRHLKENVTIVGILYAVSVVWGIIIEAIGINF